MASAPCPRQCNGSSRISFRVPHKLELRCPLGWQAEERGTCVHARTVAFRTGFCRGCREGRVSAGRVRLRHGRLDLGAAVIDARRAICRSHYRLFISLSLRNEGHNIFQTLWPFCIRTVTRTQSSMAPVRTADKDQPVAGASSGGEQKQRRKPGRVPVSCAECRRYVGLQTCICPGGE